MKTFAAIVLCALSARAGVTVENDAIAISFADSQNGFSVTSIVSKAGGGARFVHTDMKKADFWRLSFAGNGGTNDLVRIDNHGAVEDTVQKIKTHWEEAL
jgi:hypothetical protein